MICMSRWIQRTLLFTFVALGIVTISGSAIAEQRKPNVLFVMADDLNTALSGLGHPECKTPNLDRFAESGVMFTRAYCQFPLCGPSRASLMTGQYPIVNGVTGNGGKVDPARVTMPRHFRNHGYWAARVSKIYHMGIPGDIVEGTSGTDHERSWSEAFNTHALETLTPGKVVNYTDRKAPEIYPEERSKWLAAKADGNRYKMPSPVRGDYAVVEVDDSSAHLLPDTITADKAIELLRDRATKSEPFFLAVGFVRPHFPFVSTHSSLRSYHAKGLAVPELPTNDHADMPPQSFGKLLSFETEETQQLRRGYYGAIGYMDSQFGRLLKELDRLGLRDNTIVVFVSDHGYLTGEHRMWKKARLWEEAIRVPLIISAPGGRHGLVCDQMVELVDLYPTLTELAGLPKESNVQGQSLVPVLRDPNVKLDRPDALVQVSGGFGLRRGKWAYMWFRSTKKHKQEGVMLYDMDQDPKQFDNLVDDPEYDSIKAQLHRRLMERIASAKQ